MSINEAINIQTTRINAIAPTTGSLSIGDSQTTGVLNVGTNAGRTGGINIGSTTNLGAISIQTNSTLNSDATPAIAIGTSSSTKLIKIGNNADTSTVNVAKLTIGGQDINNIIGDSGVIAIGYSQTTGPLLIGLNPARSGDILIGNGNNSSHLIGIGNGTSQTSTINIGSTTGTQVIKIQTNSTLNSYANPAIQIGGGAGDKTIRIGNNNTAGTNIIGNVGFGVGVGVGNATFINNNQSETANNVNFFGGQTSGLLNIGCGDFAPSRSGNINIANQVGNTCAINILNGGGATTGGSVNIANGASQTTTVNIGSTTGTGAVTIGGASNTTNLNSGTINVNGILTMGTGDNITLQPTAGYVAPSAGQLGSSISSTGTTITLSGITLLKSVVLTSGVWILYGNCRYTTPGAFAGLGIGVSTTLIDYDSASAAIGINGMVLQVTRIVSSTTGQTYNLLANTQLNGGVTNVGLFAYRIA